MKKYFQISYTTKMGNVATMNVVGRNEQEAVANARNIRFTGSNFSVDCEIEATKETAKGSGVAIGR